MLNFIVRSMYAVKNWRAHYRGFVHGTTTMIQRALLAPTVQGATISRPMSYNSELRAKIVRSEANRPKGWRGLFWRRELDLGVISRRVITTVGVRFLCDDFNAGAASADVSNMRWHEMGTGGTAEAVGDTALQTPVESRVSGSQASATVGNNATYTTVATIVATAPRAIVEHGLFSASTAGTLWDRSVFSVINLATNDAIQFTYVLTANSGG